MNKADIEKHLLCSKNFQPQIQRLVKPLFRSSQAKYFSYNRYYKNQYWLGIYTDPDPVEDTLKRDLGPFFVDESGICIEPGCYFHEDLRETFSTTIDTEKVTQFFEQQTNAQAKKIVQNGFLILRKGKYYDESFYFSMLQDAPLARSYYQKFTPLFKSFSIYFLHKAKNLIEFCHQHRVRYKVYQAGGENFLKTFFRDEEISRNFAMENLRKFGLSTPLGEVFLSKQEFACLKHIAMGHTYDAIAEILGLKFKTVDSYVQNIKCKLNANTRAELVGYYESFRVLDPENHSPCA